MVLRSQRGEVVEVVGNEEEDAADEVGDDQGDHY